jgi:hypothetical protein
MKTWMDNLNFKYAQIAYTLVTVSLSLTLVFLRPAFARST